MRSNKQSIVIADTHSIHRAGLKALLETQADFEVIGEADNGRDALRQVARLKPDLLISQSRLPGLSGIGILQAIRKKDPSVKFLLLTAHNDEDEIRLSLDAGANGFVILDATHTELITAVKQVLAGNTYLSRNITEMLVDKLVRSKNNPQHQGELLQSITLREKQILQLIAEGHTNKRMAEKLSLSVKTVEKYRATLMKKLNLSSVPELTKYALRKGIARPSHNIYTESTSAA